MTTIQTEATAIVHAGLADVLAWLGETPVTAHQPRHAKAAWSVTSKGATVTAVWVNPRWAA